MSGELAVVLSGGGAKGAFQVGFLDELIRVRQVKVDIVVGVSTGALQALGVAQNDIARMVSVWSSLKANKDIYTTRQLGAVGAVFGADALYDASPLRKLIKSFVDETKLKKSGVKMLLGVVNLSTGQFRTIDKTVPNIDAWVYASCAMPVFFDPLVTQAADGTKEQWVDGGVRNVTPLDAALEQYPRGVIIVRASPAPKLDKLKTYGDLARIGLRAVDILQQEVSVNDYANATLINDMISVRESQFKALEAAGVTGDKAAAILRPLDVQLAKYHFARIRVVQPDKAYSDTLEFDPAKIKQGIEAGRKAVETNWEALEPLINLA